MQSKSASIIILSGGTSARFGSDKSEALIDGQSLIQRILTTIPSEFEVIIVGPDPDVAGLAYRVVQENPVGSGPVAGFKAGLEVCESEIAVLIATDMPFALPRVLNLLNSMTTHDEAVMYVDAENFKQPLAALYRVAAVERTLADMGEINGASMRALISGLVVHEVPMSDEVAHAFIDIDTKADLERAIAFAHHLKDDSVL